MTPHEEARERLALKPCPFCGGEAEILSDTKGTAIRCVNDQCIIYAPLPMPYNDAGHRNNAIEAWNRRAILSPEVGRGEEGEGSSRDHALTDCAALEWFYLTHTDPHLAHEREEAVDRLLAAVALLRGGE